ncbi:MAG: signal recognition particle-docking protein FtsY [Candidatus Woesearchaeota archaeon]
MFTFLKEKLKAAISLFTKKAEEVPAEKTEEAELPKKRAEPKSEVFEEKEFNEKERVFEGPKEAPAEKKGFFARLKEKVVEVVTTTRLSEGKFDELFWELELALLENNVAVEVVEKIKADLKAAIVDKPIPRGKLKERIAEALRQSILELFSVEAPNLLEKARSKKPFVICFFGINGSGKTTTIAKVAHLLQKNGLSTVLAASDTFRAAAIDQLQQHAEKIGSKLIKQDYGADAAAVAFDAIKHAKAAKKDVVLIDTAGRLHSNVNLMDELKKVCRVAKPDMKIFVGEALTGNDCVEQASTFDKAIGIDGIILTKADVDEKGGAAISISKVTGKPILFLGTGQGYDDLKPFEPKIVLESLGI